MQAGQYPFEDMYNEVRFEANKAMYSDHGLKAGLTKEKMDGTFVTPAWITDANKAAAYPNYLVDYIKLYFDKFPRMFVIEPELREKFLGLLKGDRIKLRKYPEVILAMYAGHHDEIPEDLRVEENTHKSILIQEMDEHISRRQSQAAGRVSD
jgi:hypothetical protein